MNVDFNFILWSFQKQVQTTDRTKYVVIEIQGKKVPNGDLAQT